MNNVLIALGNPLLSDEGVGVHILQAVEKRIPPPRTFELIDSGNSSMRILHALSGLKKAVFVDCAFMNEKPGTLRRFLPGEVASRKDIRGLSLHEGDLMTTLELAKKLGECPEEVVIFGIEPASVEPGEGLSRELGSKLEEYTDLVLREMA